MTSSLIAACATVLLLGAVPKDPAHALADKIQHFYDATDDVVADFIQTYTQIALSRSRESRGTLMLKKPGMMRWDYTAPVEKHFIADGKQLFIYEPEEEQVIIDPHFESSQLSSSFGFLWGSGKLSDSFEVSLDPKHKDASSVTKVLHLKPKKDVTYTKLSLVVEAKTGKVLESTLHETSGNTNHFKFNNVRTNSKLKASLFKFTPPPGVEVIRKP